jgi:hypothetical protein
MRSLALVLLLAGPAIAAPAKVKVVYEAKNSPKGKVAMQEAIAKHADELDAAANGKDYTVHLVLYVEGKTNTTCRITADVAAQGSIFASLSGGATLDGTGDKPVGFCVDAVIGDLVKAKIVPLIEKKSH